MDNEILDYVNGQLSQMNESFEEIKSKINSKEIESDFIDKRVATIRKQRDNTKDVLQPDFFNCDFETSEIDNLIELKDKLKEEITILNNEKEELWKNISKLKGILDNYKKNKVEVNNKNLASVDSFKIQELDRERISRDIHDGVVQNLTALIRKMEFVSMIIGQDPPRAKLEINDSKNTLKETVKELREIIYDLRPMSLDDLGFEAGFYNVCNKIKDSYNGVFEYSFSSSISLEEGKFILYKDIFINILRIIRELCSNSIKYSNGNYMYVSIEVNNEDITLTQSDNGKGFDYESSVGTKNDNTGFGLLMLSERVKSFGGSIDFSNENGSKYVITFPIN